MRLLIGSWAALFLCAACSSDPTSTPTEAGTDAPSESTAPGDGGTDASDAGPPAPSYCTDDVPQVVTTGAGMTATTTHYELYAETTQADAIDLARLLEASSAAFAAWFERPFPLGSGERFKVKYFKDQPSFAAGLAADGINAPTDAGGYFDPGTKTAYLYRQGNPYYSHVLLLHEATHQYHHLSRIKVPSLPFWYMEGHAEYLARHDWDGRCVRLGVVSLLSWEDLPSKVSPPIDVAGIVGGSVTPTRAQAWALFRYLDTNLRAKLTAYRDALDATGTASFATLVADPATLGTPLAAWLPTAQEPMKPIFTEWVHVGPSSVLVDTPGVFSLAVVKGSATHFEAKLELPASGPWTAGAVVSYTDATHYIGVVQASNGMVKTFTANGSAIWNDLGAAPLPSAKVEAFSVDFTGGNANVTFNGKSFTVAAAAPRSGLAANNTTAGFADSGWK